MIDVALMFWASVLAIAALTAGVIFAGLFSRRD